MFAIIISVLLGLGFAYFAIQNTSGVTLTLANSHVPGVPLYVIAIGSFLLGLVISWIISMIDSLFVTLTLRGKESTIKESQHTIAQLRKKVQELEIEKAQLKNDTVITQETSESHIPLKQRLQTAFR